MKLKPVVLAFLVTLAVAPSQAAAETVRASAKAKIYERPGETTPVIFTVAAGTSMKVLRTTGRWIKVRVKGRTGWITRTRVQSRAASKPRKQRKTRKAAFVEGRSKSRKPKEKAPDDRKGADAAVSEAPPPKEEAPQRSTRASNEEIIDSAEDDGDTGDIEEEEIDEEEDDDSMLVLGRSELFEKPNRRSDTVDFLVAGDKVSLLQESRSGKWAKVETRDGEIGWVRTRNLGSEGFRYPKYLFILGANVGMAHLKQSFSSNGVGDTANYDLKSWTAASQITADIVYSLSDVILLGADVAYRFSKGVPGVQYDDGNQVYEIGFLQHALSAGAKAGYVFSDSNGAAAYLRAGVNYNFLMVDENNEVEWPSESIVGLVVGARFDVPQIDSKFALRVGLDYMLPSERFQTGNIEDGDDSESSAIMASASVAYRITRNYLVAGVYSYSRASTSFTSEDGANRDHNATEADRNDQFHFISMGLSRFF